MSTPGGTNAFARVEAIYFDVLALPPAQREAALRARCAGDQALERDVRALLEAGQRLGGFLEQPALGADVSSLTQAARGIERDDLVGTRLGAYVVRERLASGGMGTVYAGERGDGQFAQKVAIKVVKRGMDSEEILGRFHAERQVLASLDHPNIARVIDGGMTNDGRPFLVMEYVEGLPIDQHCDRHRLKVGERLELFRKVCDAVHHAHQSLVIHRDLKPSNILVTPAGVPKLLDFGIAKVLSGGTHTPGETTHTVEDQRRFTPEYASPEQVVGRSMTTASDVYSLGVVLYELLAGVKPYYFGVRTHDEIRRVVTQTIPPPPSDAVGPLPPQMRGTTAPGKAQSSPQPTTTTQSQHQERSPEDTSRTRGGISPSRLRTTLRGDLDRITLMALRKEPERRYASADRLSEDIARYLRGLPVQAQRDTAWYRTRKFLQRHALAVSLSVLAIALLAGSAVALSVQASRLAAQRDRLVAANRSLEEARRYLVTILASGETGSHGPDARLGDVLREAGDALDRDPPTDALTRAASQAALGRAVMSMGEYERARDLLTRAQDAYAGVAGAEEAVFDVRIALAELDFFQGKPQIAEPALRALLAEHRAQPAPSDASLARSHGAREGLLLNDIGAAQRAQGKTVEAVATHREALAVRQHAEGADSLAAAESHNNIASALFQSGDLPGAIEQFRASLAIREARLRPGHPMIVRLWHNLGFALLRSGDTPAAVELLTKAADAWPVAFGESHPGHASSTILLSHALRTVGRTDDALLKLRSLRVWQAGRLPAESPDLAATDAHIGETLALAQRDAEALALLEPAIERLLMERTGFATIRASAGEALAAIYERAGESNRARDLRERLRQ